MKRLTTDNPKNNTENALNLFYIKDRETWVRGGGPGPEYPDVSLFDFTRQVVRDHIPDVDLPADDGNLAMMMPEWLCDGSDTAEGIIALLYTAAWSYAELRHRLMQYEDTGLTPEQIRNARETLQCFDNIGIKRGNEIVTAEEEGRLVVLPCKIGDDMWGLSRYNGHTRRVRKGTVTEMYFGDDMSLGIGLKGVGRGVFGKTVFLTREEGETALAVNTNARISPANDLYDEDGGLIGE